MQQVKNNSPHNTGLPVAQSNGLIESLFASQGGYFSDALYAYISSGKEISLSKLDSLHKKRFRWLVLGREHYFETSKDYPIANKRDLKKALQFEENQAPFEGLSLHNIERINEQSHRVTTWVIKNQVINTLPFRPWLILPESYVLAMSLKKGINLASIESISKTLFISKTGQGLFSGVQSPQTPSIEHFAFSSGSPCNTSSTSFVNVDVSKFLSYLVDGVKALNLQSLQGFLVPRQKINWQKYPWKKASLLSLSVFSLYLFTSSVWLVLQQSSIDNQIAEQSSQVNEALLLQKKYNKEIQRQTELVEPLKSQKMYWNVWHVVMEIITVGAEIKSIQLKNGDITIKGAAKKSVKATDILSHLTQNPYITEVTFSKPVRKVRGKDEFTISFNLKVITSESSGDIVEVNSKKEFEANKAIDISAQGGINAGT